MNRITFEEMDDLILDNIILLNEVNIDKFVVKHGWTRAEMLVEYEKKNKEKRE